MAKSCNQKSKILYLEKMLNESAGGKPITMQEILSTLEEHGIRAERKSIYDDMETLRLKPNDLTAVCENGFKN